MAGTRYEASWLSTTMSETPFHIRRPAIGLPQHHADGEDVGAPIDLVAAAPARAPCTRPCPSPRRCASRRGVDGLGDAEVDDLDQAVVGDEHVVRRGVAVHDAERAAVEIA